MEDGWRMVSGRWVEDGGWLVEDGWRMVSGGYMGYAWYVYGMYQNRIHPERDMFRCKLLIS